MEDKRATTQKISRGVPIGESRGIPMFGAGPGMHGDVVREDSVGHGGEPMATGNYSVRKKGCCKNTKEGKPCKAPPMKGEKVCVGHSKQNDEN